MGDYYYLGKITRTHGLKGHFLIYLDTDTFDPYLSLREFFILNEGCYIPFQLEEVTLYKDKFLKCLIKGLRIEQVEEQFIGKEVYLPMESLPNLNEDQFYYHEIIGFSIVNNSNCKIGIVQEVIEHPSNPLLSVSSGKKSFFVPIVSEWIKKVDKKGKVLHMNLPEGLESL